MTTLASRWLVVAAIVGAVGVALGAFGAHGLPDRLVAMQYDAADVKQRVETFDTAARYQLLHALALGLAAVVLDRSPGRIVGLACWAFLIGVVVFSGLLYSLTFAGPDYRWLGAVVPLGGLSLIVGWLALAVAGFRQSG